MKDSAVLSAGGYRKLEWAMIVGCAGVVAHTSREAIPCERRRRSREKYP